MRHKVRNLRAKVHSLLPQEICPKELQRLAKIRRMQSSDKRKINKSNSSKEVAKQFDKLTDK